MVALDWHLSLNYTNSQPFFIMDIINMHQSSKSTYSEHLITNFESLGIAELVMNRPKVKNAWNMEMVDQLISTFHQLASMSSVRVVIIRGAEGAFCAGGDLNWMKSILSSSRGERRADAEKVSLLMQVLDNFPKPLIAQVEGPAMAGGLGMLCAADVTIASETAIFGLGEVRIGVIPAVISPYVIRKIGLNFARAYCLSGARFNCDIAEKIGLVHYRVPSNDIAEQVSRIAEDFFRAGPNALRTAKMLFKKAVPAREGIEEEVLRQIVEIWETEEAIDGISSFLEKRKPSWAP